MFKAGDTVICINDSSAGSSGLKLHNKYVVDIIFDRMYCYLFPIKPNGEVEKNSYVFLNERFINIVEFRKQKIEKIRNEIQKRRCSSLCE